MNNSQLKLGYILVLILIYIGSHLKIDEIQYYFIFIIRIFFLFYISNEIQKYFKGNE